MRTAQQVALASRPYALLALRLLAILSGRRAQDSLEREQEDASPYTETRAVQKTLVVLVSSDKGLAGSFNKEVFRTALRFFESDEYKDVAGHSYAVAAVGVKARDFARMHKWDLDASFEGFGDFVNASETAPLAEHILDGFAAGRFDRVVMIAMNFRTALKQEPLVRTVLPARLESIKETVHAIVPEHGRFAGVPEPKGFAGISEEEAIKRGQFAAQAEREYLFEPTPEAVLSELVPILIRMQVHHLILEANASEHSARRVAMKTATDNARDLETSLTRVLNKARQENITAELLDSIGTQTALN